MNVVGVGVREMAMNATNLIHLVFFFKMLQLIIFYRNGVRNVEC